MLVLSLLTAVVALLAAAAVALAVVALRRTARPRGAPVDALPEDLGAVSEERVEGQQEEEGKGVDLIFVEAVREEGVGLAVMERARKAAGGAGEMEFAL